MEFDAVYDVTLTDEQMCSLALAIRDRLEQYRREPPHFTIEDAPATSHIGKLRELSGFIDAIRLGNRQGGKNTFNLRMVRKVAS